MGAKSAGKHRFLRERSLLFGALALISISSACSDSTSPPQPLDPTIHSPTPNPIGPPPPYVDAPATSVVYNGDDAIYGLPGWDRYNGGRLISRYVLNVDGTFSLQYSSPIFGLYDYRGEYSRSDTQIVFAFDGYPGAAVADLLGDSFFVKYAPIMTANGFVDGKYVRVPSSAGTP